MVDGVLLLVDAVEGPMPQTRFVTRKALALGLKPIVVVNKVDRPGARPDWVVNQTFDLFDKLGATDEQLDFPVIYASALQRLGEHWTARERGTDMAPLFEPILSTCRRRDGDAGRAAAAADLARSTTRATSAASASAASAAARVQAGAGRRCVWTARTATPVKAQDQPGADVQGPASACRSTKPVAGDIVLITGIEDVGIGVTRHATRATRQPLPMLKVDEPTLTMNFQVNTSPLAGREGKFVTSRQIRERLQRELQTQRRAARRGDRRRRTSSASRAAASCT